MRYNKKKIKRFLMLLLVAITGFLVVSVVYLWLEEYIRHQEVIQQFKYRYIYKLPPGSCPACSTSPETQKF
ncbi:MAG TPA: hypothetical protein PLQ41_06020 [bacterium]|nr:hypothetical protein [bacterium]